MPYATIPDQKTELIRTGPDGSAFIAPITAAAITALTTGSPTTEVQTATITGTPTGGPFRLTFNGSQTATIAYNAAASAVQSALEALPNISPGDVTVTGGAGGPYTITFGGQYLNENVNQITATSALTGGTSPTVNVTTATPGTSVDLAPLPNGYADIGYLTSDGTSFSRETEVNEVTSWGSVEPTRSDVTRDTITMAITAQETSKTVLEMYTGADLSETLATAGTGEFSIEKPDRPAFRYFRVLALAVDQGDYGEIYIARFMPRARVTEYGEQVFNQEGEIQYPMTFTGFNDSTEGYSHRWIFGGPGWEALLTEMGIGQA